MDALPLAGYRFFTTEPLLLCYQGFVKATSGSRAIEFDPLVSRIDLPFSAKFYPAGFTLDLTSNSGEVIEAATETWGGWAKEFECEPVSIRVIVQEQGPLAPQPSFRRQGHLFSIVSDADNFAVADLESLFGCVYVSASTAAEHAWLRWFFLESLGYALLAQRYIVPVHAACVSRNGTGVLLCGPSGAGKSTLSYACARSGWTFISDDGTWLLPDREDRAAIGRPGQARFRLDSARLFPELAGFSERAHPNGKLSLEVALGEFPEIRKGSRCTIAGTVILDRKAGATARAEAISSGEVAELLLQDTASYGDAPDALHLRTIQNLTGIPAYRLFYDGPEEAVQVLAQLAL